MSAKVSIVSDRAGPAGEGHMWLVRSWSIGFVAAISLLAQGAAQAEPVRIRVSWIAPLSNWASLLM
jgi:NitT/TauT family transport system substrate-binding protein